MDDDPNSTLASVLLVAVVLLIAGLAGDRPLIRRIGRWKLPPQTPVKHDDLALVVLIALAVAFALLAKP
jgi:hypothetical protein